LDFYFPLLFLVPGFEGPAIDCPPFRLARRKWETSPFDLATLATRHKLHLPYQSMDVFLSSCNMELCVQGKTTVIEAIDALNTLRVALYASGVSPFLCPFATTHSINEYSGINSRDSETLRAKMYPGMEVGLKSDADTLEAWPFELSFQCALVDEGALRVTADAFVESVGKAERLGMVLLRTPQLTAVLSATIAAPTLGHLGQSLLHVWSAVEALFPTVNSELSFRLALYLAQLNEQGSKRQDYYDTVRSAYAIRSKVAHGSKANVSTEEWQQGWKILMDSINALHRRNALPSEQELLAELLS